MDSYDSAYGAYAVAFFLTFFLVNLPSFITQLNTTFTSAGILDVNGVITSTGQYYLAAISGLIFYGLEVFAPNYLTFAPNIASAVAAAVVQYFASLPSVILWISPTITALNTATGLTTKGQVVMGACGAIAMYFALPIFGMSGKWGW